MPARKSKKKAKDMTKRSLILITALVLLVVIFVSWWVLYRDDRPVNSVANAPVTSGVSLVFSAPLSSKAKAVIENSEGKTVKTVDLEVGAQRYNIELPPAAYAARVESVDGKFAPTTSAAVTVVSGVLAELSITLPATEPSE